MADEILNNSDQNTADSTEDKRRQIAERLKELNTPVDGQETEMQRKQRELQERLAEIRRKNDAKAEDTIVVTETVVETKTVVEETTAAGTENEKTEVVSETTDITTTTDVVIEVDDTVVAEDTTADVVDVDDIPEVENQAEVAENDAPDDKTDHSDAHTNYAAEAEKGYDDFSYDLPSAVYAYSEKEDKPKEDNNTDTIVVTESSVNESSNAEASATNVIVEEHNTVENTTNIVVEEHNTVEINNTIIVEEPADSDHTTTVIVTEVPDSTSTETIAIDEESKNDTVIIDEDVTPEMKSAEAENDKDSTVPNEKTKNDKTDEVENTVESIVEQPTDEKNTEEKAAVVEAGATTTNNTTTTTKTTTTKTTINTTVKKEEKRRVGMGLILLLVLLFLLISTTLYFYFNQDQFHKIVASFTKTEATDNASTVVATDETDETDENTTTIAETDDTDGKNGDANTATTATDTDSILDPQKRINDKWGLARPCWVISYGSFKSQQSAEKETVKLKALGYNAGYYWIPDYLEKNPRELYKVYVGPFRRYSDAYAKLNTVRELSRDKDAYIVKVD